MKILDKMANTFTPKSKKDFKDLNGIVLCLIGAISFLVAGYWGLMLKDVVPLLIEATNKSDCSLTVFALWFYLGFFAVVVWFFGSIATRCHSLLYERWFK